MSIEFKQAFISSVAKQLGSTLTYSDIGNLISVLESELSGYELNRATGESTDVETSELLDEFLATKTVEGKSPKTIARYRFILTRMFDYINTPIRSIMVFTLRRYLAKLKDDGLQEVTIEGVRSIICSFFGWLHRESLLPSNPAANLGHIKCEKKIKVPFTSTDVESLKEYCDNIRDKAILSVLLSTGCRISEICGMDRDDIDFVNMQCTVLGKGNKQRIVYIDDVAAMLLRRYLITRTDDSKALFIGKSSERLTPGGIRYMLNTLADKAGVDHVHPHRFRRTFATSLAAHGMPIQEVAHILGHDKLETTMKYVYVNSEAVKHDYKKYAG